MYRSVLDFDFGVEVGFYLCDGLDGVVGADDRLLIFEHGSDDSFAVGAFLCHGGEQAFVGDGGFFFLLLGVVGSGFESAMDLFLLQITEECSCERLAFDYGLESCDFFMFNLILWWLIKWLIV